MVLKQRVTITHTHFDIQQASSYVEWRCSNKCFDNLFLSILWKLDITLLKTKIITLASNLLKSFRKSFLYWQPWRQTHRQQTFTIPTVGRVREGEGSGGREQIHETKGDKLLMTAAQAQSKSTKGWRTRARTHKERSQQHALRAPTKTFCGKGCPEPTTKPCLHPPLPPKCTSHSYHTAAFQTLGQGCSLQLVR